MTAQDPSLERSFRGHKDVITGLSFKKSMTQLASSSFDHSVMVWNFKPQLRVFRFVGHKGVVTSVDFSHSGHLLASSSRDKTVRLWTPNIKGDVTVFRAHTSSVRTVQFSHDSENLLTASDDKSVKFWSTNRTKFQFTLAGHLNWVRTAKFSPDSRLVVSGSDDKTVKLWDLRSKTCIKTYWDHTGMVSSVDFHPSGTIVASASIDKSIKLFDIRTHKLIQHYGDAHQGGSNESGATSNIGGVNSIGFGGERGEWMISTGNDGLVKIWDLKEGHLLYTLYGHKFGSTTSAVFSPQGDFFATGGSDSQVMVWKSNLDTISQIADINHRREQPLDNRTDRDISSAYENGPNVYTEPAISAPTSQKRPITPIGVHSASGGISFSKPSSPIHNGKQERTPDIVNVGPVLDTSMPPERPPRSSSPGGYRRTPSPVRTQPQTVHIDNEVSASEARTTSLQTHELPELISSINNLTEQFSMLTQTISIMENRLTLNEDAVSEMNQKFNQVLNKLGGSSSPLATTAKST